jgi:hypothetical protein
VARWAVRTATWASRSAPNRDAGPETVRLDHVLDPAHRPLAEIRVGDARKLGDVLGDLAGTVDLVFADAHPEYVLTGLITCSRYQRHYVGVAAQGKRHRYRY